MNKKLTTPKAILIGSLMIAGTILYTNGFNFSIIPEAKADVGGMDYRDLRRDRDFKKAVKYIVERCSIYIDGEDGSISC
jgi:hypothetical protein